MNFTYKTVCLLTGLVTLTACSVSTTTTTTTIPAVKAPEITVEHRAAYSDTHQHVALSLLAAGHYCVNKTWPASIPAIKAYQQKYGVPVPLKIDWDWLSASTTSYTVEENLVIQTPATDNSYTVTSTNKPPSCSDNPVTANVAVVSVASSDTKG